MNHQMMISQALHELDLFLIYTFYYGCGKRFRSQAKAKDYLRWRKCYRNNERTINRLLCIPELILCFLSQISAFSAPISNSDSGLLIDADGMAKGQGGEHSQ